MNLEKEFTRYLFEYRYENAEWGVEIVATSPEDARERLKVLSWARYQGEIKAKFYIPGSDALSGVARCIRQLLSSLLGREGIMSDEENFSEGCDEAAMAALEAQEKENTILREEVESLKTSIGEIIYVRDQSEKRLRAENARLREALKPFAEVAKHDIGDDETDDYRFRPMLTHNRAPHINVGHLRAAAAAIWEESDSETPMRRSFSGDDE